jgi:uncharacterized protein with HEPN domain
MPQRDLEIGTLLLDVMNACATIAEVVANRTFEDYRADLLARNTVERQFIIVGEALRAALPREPALAEVIPDIRKIIDFRNLLVHGYRKLDDALVWQTVCEDLPVLAAAVRDLLGP